MNIERAPKIPVWRRPPNSRFLIGSLTVVLALVTFSFLVPIAKQGEPSTRLAERRVAQSAAPNLEEAMRTLAGEGVDIDALESHIADFRDIPVVLRGVQRDDLNKSSFQGKVLVIIKDWTEESSSSHHVSTIDWQTESLLPTNLHPHNVNDVQTVVWMTWGTDSISRVDYKKFDTGEIVGSSIRQRAQVAVIDKRRRSVIATHIVYGDMPSRNVERDASSNDLSAVKGAVEGTEFGERPRPGIARWLSTLSAH